AVDSLRRSIFVPPPMVPSPPPLHPEPPSSPLAPPSSLPPRAAVFPAHAALFPAGAALHSPSVLQAGTPQIESSKSAGQRPDPPRPHLVEMGCAGRGRSRQRATCASSPLGRLRPDPARRQPPC
uniref:Uncharacterized protein n=1 Tax=Aegilops tauschii subsp. strangulata TaxID=200361 RepID=A0A453IUB2_AEGTS